jgi:hypothetical protein
MPHHSEASISFSAHFTAPQPWARILIRHSPGFGIPTQTVGRILNTDRLGEVLNDVPNHLFCQPISPNDPALIDGAEETVGCSSRRLDPVIDPRFDPIGNRHRANMTTFAFQIHNGPVIFAPLQVSGGRLRSAVVRIPGARRGDRGRAFPSKCRLPALQPKLYSFGSQPVATPHTELFCTFYPPYSGRKFRTQKTGIGRLVGQASHRREPLIDCRWSQTKLFQLHSVPGDDNSI